MTTIMVLFLTTTTIPLPPSLRLFPLPPCDALHPLESTPTCGLHHFRTTPWFYIRRQYLAQHLLPPLLQTPIFPIPAVLLSRARTLTADMVSSLPVFFSRTPPHQAVLCTCAHTPLYACQRRPPPYTTYTLLPFHLYNIFAPCTSQPQIETTPFTTPCFLPQNKPTPPTTYLHHDNPFNALSPTSYSATMLTKPAVTSNRPQQTKKYSDGLSTYPDEIAPPLDQQDPMITEPSSPEPIQPLELTHPQPTTRASEKPVNHPPGQEDDLTGIINDINQPDLLTDTSSGLDLPSASSPSTSHAKKKFKTNSEEPSSHSSPNPTSASSQKKKSKKRDNPSTNVPASDLWPSNYSTAPSHIADEHGLPPTHIHIHKNIFVDLSIDFNIDYLAQFKGNNGKMVYSIQQLLFNLKIADKTACFQPTELSVEDPPLGDPQDVPYICRNHQALAKFLGDLHQDKQTHIDGDNQRNMVYTIREARPHLKIADTTVLLSLVEQSSDVPPIGGNSSHNMATNKTSLGDYGVSHNPCAFLSEGMVTTDIPTLGNPLLNTNPSAALDPGIDSKSSRQLRQFTHSRFTSSTPPLKRR